MICTKCNLEKNETAFGIASIAMNGEVRRRKVCQACRQRDYRMNKRYEQRLIAWYDTETTSLDKYGLPYAYALGIINDGVQLSEITPETVENLIDFHLVRTASEFENRLRSVCDRYWNKRINPIIAVHNLGFDMYSLRDIFKWGEVSTIAKSSSNPITITITIDDYRKVIFWDSLGYSGYSLETMGRRCGYAKMSGDLDYSLIRHPETPLTEKEIGYIRHDVFVPWVWLAQDAKVKELSITDYCNRILTKTSFVRFDCRRSFPKSQKDMQKKARYNNPYEEKERQFVSNCMQGGWSVVSSVHVGKKFKDVLSVDATSQHPSQGVSHKIPYGFGIAPLRMLQDIAEMNINTSIEYVKKHWVKPFDYAFEFKVNFENIRLKADFRKHGIGLIQRGRINHDYMVTYGEDSEELYKARYTEWAAVNPEYKMNKLTKADSVTLYAHELFLWSLSQVYEWDSMTVLDGFYTSKFRKPYEFFIDSVVKYYDGKNKFKRNMTGDLSEPCESAPQYMLEWCKDFDNCTAAQKNEINSFYNEMLKGGLNGLYGVQATNPLRWEYSINGDHEQIVFTDGMVYNENAKNDFRFGERIVGWAMLHQILAFDALKGDCDAFIFADTDSWKVHSSTKTDSELLENLEELCTIDDASIRSMVGEDRFNKLSGLGHYTHDGKYDEFVASHMKSYVYVSNGHLKITCAGFSPDHPHQTENDTITKYFEGKYNDGSMTIEDIFKVVFGFNSIWTAAATGANGKIVPSHTRITETVIDYLGNEYTCDEPAMLTLFPMTKVMKFTGTNTNAEMLQLYKDNGALVGLDMVIDYSGGEFNVASRC